MRTRGLKGAYMRVHILYLICIFLFFAVCGWSPATAQQSADSLVVWGDDKAKALKVKQSTIPYTQSDLVAKPKPRDAFNGCASPIEAAPTPPTPVNEPSSSPRSDIKKRRTFAAMAEPDAKIAMAEPVFSDECWYRLDGIWRQDADVSFDTSVNVKSWDSEVTELLALAHGTYSNIKYILIEPSADSNQVLNVLDAEKPWVRAKFKNSGGPSLDDVFMADGPRKIYTAVGKSDFGSKLIVDLTRTGQIRIKLGKTFFYRPKPSVTKVDAKGQISSDDAFLLSANLDNLKATRTGYNVVTQDGFYFLKNKKSEVFAEADPKDYNLDEKRTVPLGLILVPEIIQGTIFQKEFSSSERSMQETTSLSFGGSLSSEVAGPSVAASYSQTQFKAMTRSGSVAQSIGYSRAKQYALVRDHPYSELSDRFIDAVADARRYGDEEPSNYQAIIDKFGTHYPYAVTYGAAAKMTHSMDERSYRSQLGKSQEANVSAGFTVYGTSGSVNVGGGISKNSENSGTIGSEKTTFVGVGGNGSWNENGWTKGDVTYPILLDLRPIDELLTPMNFPNEPEIYLKVRSKLKTAIDSYLISKSNLLSDRSAVPENKNIEGDYIVLGLPRINRFQMDGDDHLKVATLVKGRPKYWTKLNRVSATEFEAPDGRGFFYGVKSDGTVYVRGGENRTLMPESQGIAGDYRIQRGSAINRYKMTSPTVLRVTALKNGKEQLWHTYKKGEDGLFRDHKNNVYGKHDRDPTIYWQRGGKGARTWLTAQ